MDRSICKKNVLEIGKHLELVVVHQVVGTAAGNRSKLNQLLDWLPLGTHFISKWYNGEFFLLGDDLIGWFPVTERNLASCGLLKFDCFLINF